VTTANTDRANAPKACPTVTDWPLLGYTLTNHSAALKITVETPEYSKEALGAFGTNSIRALLDIMAVT